MKPAADLSLYLVTDTRLCAPRPVADVVRAAVAGGATAVQVRDKEASRRELLALTRSVQAALADRPDVTVWVNDAVDVALLAGVHGVHVGQDDLPVAEVRALVGPDRLLGLSLSTDDELAAARALPAGTVDVVGIGPLWATATKRDARAALGVDRARELVTAARAGGLRAVVIGGIDATRAPAAATTGADGICVVSDVCTATDPAAAARLLRAGAAPAAAR